MPRSCGSHKARRYTPTLVSRAKPAPINTAAVAKAAGVHVSTITRWVKAGLLPAPETRREGVRGMRVRWPRHAPEQAAWVAALLADGWSYDEIRGAIDAGEFKPSSTGEDT